jgi:hypothetical protein
MQKIMISAETAITTSHTIVERVGAVDAGRLFGRERRGRRHSIELVSSDQRPMNAEASTAWNSTRRDPTTQTFGEAGPSFEKESIAVCSRSCASATFFGARLVARVVLPQGRPWRHRRPERESVRKAHRDRVDTAEHVGALVLAEAEVGDEAG